MVFYDYIEIGTSDFATEIQKIDNKIGISIEPVKYYLDKLPDKKNCIKLNIGISNYNGKSMVYYLSEENIKKYNFPKGIRGCNTINSYHKTVSRLCKEKNLNIEEISESYQIDVYTLHNIFNQMNVDGVYYLKIDTEGHDTVILKKFYEDIHHNFYLPHVILFESNALSSNHDIQEIISLFSNKGYDLISKNVDTKLQLDLTKLKNKTSFTVGLKNYYIMELPLNYDITKLPYENSLESAKEYCIKHNCSGITLQNGVYEVRNGKYLNYCNDNSIISWTFI